MRAEALLEEARNEVTAIALIAHSTLERTLLGRNPFLAIGSLALRSRVAISVAGGDGNRVDIHLFDTLGDSVGGAVDRSASDDVVVHVNFLSGRFSIGILVLVLLAQLLVGFGEALRAARQRGTRRDGGLTGGEHLTLVLRVFLRQVTHLFAGRFGGALAFGAAGWGGVVGVINGLSSRR